jgi:hypothetical protein
MFASFTGHSAEDWKTQNAKDWQVTIPGDTPWLRSGAPLPVNGLAIIFVA